MSDDVGDGGPMPPSHGEVDAGEPVAGLSDLEIDPSAGFLHRLRNDIARRSLASQFLSLTWYAPKMVLLEFVTMVFSLFRPADDRKGDRP